MADPIWLAVKFDKVGAIVRTRVVVASKAQALAISDREPDEAYFIHEREYRAAENAEKELDSTVDRTAMALDFLGHGSGFGPGKRVPPVNERVQAVVAELHLWRKLARQIVSADARATDDELRVLVWQRLRDEVPF